MLFPVGDYSCDGHNCYAKYVVQSEQPVESIVAAHKREEAFLGSLCSEYENNKIDVYGLYVFLLKYLDETQSVSFLQSLVDGGIELIDDDEEFERLFNKKHTPKEISLSVIEDEDNMQYLIIDNTDQMLEVWLKLLNTINPDLGITRASEALSEYSIKYKGYPHTIDGKITDFVRDTPGYGVWIDYQGEFHNDCS